MKTRFPLSADSAAVGSAFTYDLRRALLTLLLIFSFFLPWTLPATQVNAEDAAPSKDIVNIGVTNTINTMNPLLFDGTIVNTHALGLQWLPLVEVGSDLSFVYHLAEEVTTEDNLTFKIKLRDEAKWSDGEDITADDVIFTILKVTSRGVSNLNVYGYSLFEGFDEGGQIADDATLEDVPSIKKLDDKTLTMTASSHLPLATFLNNYLSYLFVIPQHIYGDYSAEELKTTTDFNHPEVISGPYRLVDLSLDHFASYTANENYWLGEPKIKNLNIKVLQGAGLLAGLQSGEIDVIQPTMATIPVEDQAAIEGLDGYTVVYDKPLTNNLLFINHEVITDAKVRQAIHMAIDRQLLLDAFINGKGEVTEGFVSSFSPYFDEELENTAYDPEAAKALIEESDWDPDQELKYIINSGDPIFANAANLVVQELGDIGIKAKVQSLDLNSLLAAANSGDYDILSVQYTILPLDYIMDIQFLADSGEGTSNWSNYQSEEMHQAIMDALEVNDDDVEGLTAAYGKIDRLVQQDDPFISLYFQSPMGVVSDKLENVEPSAYGFFAHVEEWNFAPAE